MVLVVGATGQLGGAITRLLIEGGHQVRALVRGDAAVEGAQLARGDLKDRASLDAACRGVDTIITTANSAGRDGDDNVQSVDLQGNQNLIDAAAAAGVQQFIFVSAQIADVNSPMPFLQAKGRSEQNLQASGIPYTILAPNAFMDIWVGGVVGAPAIAGRPVTVVGSGTRKHSFIAAQDVARFAVAAIGHPRALNERLVLGGPEALSFREVAAIFGRVLGREVKVESVPPGEPVPGFPPVVGAIMAGLDMADCVADTHGLAQTFGVPLTPVEAFARQMVAPGV